MLLITRKIPPAVAARAAREHMVRQLEIQGVFDSAVLLENLEGVDAILCTPADRFDAALIGKLPQQVRVIATFSVGLEHIDLAAAAAQGVEVCNTPDVLSTATAELALTLMLMAARRAGEGERLLRAGKWAGLSPTFFLGRRVSGLSLIHISIATRQSAPRHPRHCPAPCSPPPPPASTSQSAPHSASGMSPPRPVH